MTRDEIMKLARECEFVAGDSEAYDRCRQALLAAIEQALTPGEPVAWMTRFDDPERGSYGKPADTHLKRDEAERQVQRHIDKRLCKLRVEPLYTAPQPQREWVGLTDVEWMNIVNKNHAWFGLPPDQVAHEVCKLTEAKLKEKNT